MLRAITLDFWDTLYVGAARSERMRLRRAAIRRMLEAIGRSMDDAEFEFLYDASGARAMQWWRDEHRGYTTEDRIRWMLAELDIERPQDCEHVARACAEVDEALLAFPPPLLPGAAELVERLASRFALAIVSDTGFASGRAQDRLMERDGIRARFGATVYSMDVGYAKPRPEPFLAACSALGVTPAEALHVGDLERTDVLGALGAGLRAVRLDLVRPGGKSAAEHVTSSMDELADYLLRQ